MDVVTFCDIRISGGGIRTYGVRGVAEGLAGGKGKKGNNPSL